MTFADTLRDLAGARGIALPHPRHPEPLAALAYAAELELKNATLAAFWRAQRLPGEPEPVVAAPQPRGYRTTSKRRAVAGRRGVTLAFPGALHGDGGRGGSALDLREHVAVYDWLPERLDRPALRPLGATLGHVIVRGSPGALAVILNVRALDATIVRAAKLLADDLQGMPLGVRAALLYLDPTGSDYYLEARRPDVAVPEKRLFGPDRLQVEAGGVRLHFPLTVFSQVNGPMVGVLVDAARAQLAPLAGHELLDLYCGYGLLALSVGRDAARVLGVDHDGPAIAAARANAQHLGQADRVRFVAGRIDAPFVAHRLPPPGRAPALALLDPPRQGTAPGVVAAVAARAPARVLHVCCGADEIPREAAAWAKAGYRLERAVPLDLFPGTAGLETLLLLLPPEGRSRADR